MAITQADSAASFFFPELMAIADETIRAWMQDASFDDYRVYLAKQLLMDVCRSGESENDSYSDSEEKIMFLDF